MKYILIILTHLTTTQKITNIECCENFETDSELENCREKILKSGPDKFFSCLCTEEEIDGSISDFPCSVSHMSRMNTRPISVWSAANFLLNALLLVLLGSFCLLRTIKSPFDALIATLAGTILIIVLITFAGFSSLSQEANKAAAGFAILFSVTALMIVSIILYLILTSDQSSENQTQTDSVPIEPIQNVTVNTIS